MPITQMLDLLLAQPIQAMIPLAQITLPILPFAVCDTAKCKNADANLPCEIDCVASRVFRLFGAPVCPVVALASK